MINLWKNIKFLTLDEVFFYTSFLNHCLGLVKIEDGDSSTSSAHAQCQVPNFMTSVSNSWEAVNTRCLRNALQGFTSPNRKLTCCHLASYESSKGYTYLLWKFYILIKIWILVCLFRDGARQYPPHPMEHAAMESKKHTINITIGFPFQHQQVPSP